MTAQEPLGPLVPIRALRKAQGLSIPALVARIAELGVTVHPDTISNVELGRRRASTSLLFPWTLALGIGIGPGDVHQPIAEADKAA